MDDTASVMFGESPGELGDETRRPHLARVCIPSLWIAEAFEEALVKHISEHGGHKKGFFVRYRVAGSRTGSVTSVWVDPNAPVRFVYGTEVPPKNYERMMEFSQIVDLFLEQLNNYSVDLTPCS